MRGTKATPVLEAGRLPSVKPLQMFNTNVRGAEARATFWKQTALSICEARAVFNKLQGHW
eukprot:1521164-Pyramimonas_sp.AAC.1